MATLPRFRQGRILWARLRSQKGKKELHPAVIITADQDIIQPEEFDPRQAIGKANAVAVVGVSTEFRKYPPYILIPFSRNLGGHPTTKFSQECGACIGWYGWVVLEDDVAGFGGELPAALLNQIIDAIAVDLKKKVATKAAQLGKELVNVSELLGELIGEP